MKNKKPKKLTLINNTSLAYAQNSEAKIPEHKKDYYELVEFLPEIIFELDLNGNITYVNKRGTELLGYTLEEVLGKPAVIFVLDKEQGRADNGIKKTVQGKKYSAVDYYFIKKDGTPLPFLIYTSQIYNKDNETVGIRGVAIDATSRIEAEKALNENKKLFSIIAEQTIVGITIIQDSKFVFINDYFAQLINYTVDDLKKLRTKKILSHVHADDSERIIEYIINLQKGNKNESNNIQFRVADKDGKIRWVDIWSQIINYQGKASIFTFGRDITQQKNTERALKEKEDRFHALLENSMEIIAVFDESGILQYASQPVSKMLGYSQQELIGTYVFDLVHPNDSDRLLMLFNEAKESQIKTINIEFRCRHKDGSWRFMATTANNHLDDPAVNGIVINLRDVTDRKEAEEKAIYYEFHDPLTGLPNREMFISRLEIEIQQAQSSRRKNDMEAFQFAVMCLGLDKFKNINDIYGPSVGDTLLQKFGQRLKKNFRDRDLVTRFGGDTYMILITGIENSNDIVEIIQKTLDIFSDPIVIEKNIFRVTASIGVCLYPHDGFNKEQLLKNSEAAMYMAKEHGRNTYRLFDAKMNTEMLMRLQLEKDLEQAIFYNHFQAYYQPKVDINGRILGIESLVRWISSKDGKIILPSYFIEVAEKSGMIIDLGNIVLYQASAQNKIWQDRGYPAIQVAVNISPHQFIQPNLVPNINNILKQTGLGPQYLELELTESGIMEDEGESIKKLNELHDLGVKITIDDFGTGYSSLSKLKDYPIDTLKIDRSFVENLPGNNKSSTITTTIIDLAHNLGFKVIAEGVETKEQLDFLHRHNCDQYQGYYFSRPLPADKIEEKLKTSKIS